MNEPLDFVDRTPHLDEFERMLVSPPPADTGRVLVWWGPGGQGKTALCTEMVKRARVASERIGIGLLDFAIPRYRNPTEALLRLREDFARTGHLRFDRFDYAFGCLFTRERPARDLRAAHPELFVQKNELLESLFDLLSDTVLPGASVAYKWLMRLLERENLRINLRALSGECNEIENLSPAQLREKLPAYFAADLRDAMLLSDPIRVVLMIDTYDAIRDRQGGALMPAQDWVRALVHEARGAIVAIFSRAEFSWGDSCVPKPLGKLDDDYAHDFLAGKGITSEAIRSRIVAGADGLPYCLMLALNQYRTMRSAGREPSVEDFAHTPDEVLERFLSHLSELEQIELRLASYLHVIDEDTWYDLCATFGVRAHANWTTFRRLSYVTADDDTHLHLHALMRKTLQAREHSQFPRLFDAVHSYLWNKYSQEAASGDRAAISSKHEQALRVAAQHCLEVKPQAFAAWFFGPLWQPFYDAGRWRGLAGVFALVDDVEAIFSTDDPTVGPAAFYHHHAHIWQSMGDLAHARQLYQRALDRYPPAQTNSPQFATTLDALANVCLEDGDWQAAEPLLERARTIYETTEHPYLVRHAYAASNLGRGRYMSGHTEEAIKLFQEAYERFGVIEKENRREFAGFLVTWARLFRSHRRRDEEQRLLEQALDAYARLDGGLDGQATVLIDLAICAADTGHRAASVDYINRAIPAHETAFGARHPNTAYARHLQAAFWLQDNPTHPSAVSQLADAVVVLTESVGADHEWTRQAGAALNRAKQLSPEPV